MPSTSSDKAPWQRSEPEPPAAPREEPVWTGLIPAVTPAGSQAPGAPAPGIPAPGTPAGQERSGPDARPVRSTGPALGHDEAGPEDAPADEDEQARRRAARRHEAVADEPRLPRVQQVFLAVLLPLVLLAAAVRAVATPLFLWAEYHRPGFPADPWGFGTEERTVLGSYGLDYVLNWAPAPYLADVRDDEGNRLFLPTEVAHMTDVKIVLQVALAAVVVLALVGLVSALYLRARAPGAASGALFFGSWLTVVLLVLLAVAALVAWQQFFTAFHSLFFADGSWTFRASDTLIRLYPTQFWTDAAVAVGALTLLGALAVMAATWPTAFRRHRALDRVRRRQELRRRLAGR
ncbi:TIGR01906 family membrane protein [Kocuria flava]|uniref:TIGR01906 family membrane protein n=1 Tax=Kocuria flava TaxID=446860 RepID=UPI002F95CBDB